MKKVFFSFLLLGYPASAFNLESLRKFIQRETSSLLGVNKFQGLAPLKIQLEGLAGQVSNALNDLSNEKNRESNLEKKRTSLEKTISNLKLKNVQDSFSVLQKKLSSALNNINKPSQQIISELEGFKKFLGELEEKVAEIEQQEHDPTYHQPSSKKPPLFRYEDTLGTSSSRCDDGLVIGLDTILNVPQTLLGYQCWINENDLKPVLQKISPDLTMDDRGVIKDKNDALVSIETPQLLPMDIFKPTYTSYYKDKPTHFIYEPVITNGTGTCGKGSIVIGDKSYPIGQNTHHFEDKVLCEINSDTLKDFFRDKTKGIFSADGSIKNVNNQIRAILNPQLKGFKEALSQDPNPTDIPVNNANKSLPVKEESSTMVEKSFSSTTEGSSSVSMSSTSSTTESSSQKTSSLTPTASTSFDSTIAPTASTSSTGTSVTTTSVETPSSVAPSSMAPAFSTMGPVSTTVSWTSAPNPSGIIPSASTSAPSIHPRHRHDRHKSHGINHQKNTQNHLPIPQTVLPSNPSNFGIPPMNSSSTSSKQGIPVSMPSRIPPPMPSPITMPVTTPMSSNIQNPSNPSEKENITPSASLVPNPSHALKPI